MTRPMKSGRRIAFRPTSSWRRRLRHINSPRPIKERFDVSAAPIFGFRAHRAVWVLNSSGPPILKQIEAARALPNPAFRPSEARQGLQQLIDCHTCRCCREGNDGWGWIAAASDVGLTLTPLILFRVLTA